MFGRDRLNGSACVRALAMLRRAVLVTLIFCVTYTSLGIAGAMPVPAAAAAGSAMGKGSRFGLVADVGTRYGHYGKQSGPIGVLSQTGATWVKEEFRWDWVEPSRGKWTWAFMDEAVNEEHKRGMQILGLLDYTAGWAVGEDRRVSTTPPPLDLWANYVAQTVGRYKDRVHAWEVWNEPNEPVFWSGTKEQYAQLLAVTYDTIKRVDPNAVVLGPVITGIDEAWLDAMPWDKFDVLGIHVYVPPAFLSDQEYSLWHQGLPNFQQVVARHDPNKPIWITEFGFSSQHGGSAWHVGDEGLQARYLAQQIATMLAYTGLNIELIMPYAFNDDTPGGGFGLTRHDWATRKPAFAAYRTAVDRLDGAQPRGRFDAGPGVFGYRFVKDGKLVDVVWAPHGGTAVVPSGSDGEVYDLYGGRRTVGRSGSELRVDVGADPVYVLHTEATAGGGNPFGGGASHRFAETGKTVSGPFLAYWQTRGGLPIYGYPISEPFMETLEDGKTYLVQYFERARFEYHPENQPPYDVLLGQFGRAIHPAYPGVGPVHGGRYFPETGHNIVGAFQAYWEANGGLPQFGYPITEEVEERLEDGRVYRVQYFERARFEYHPENAAPYDVLLGHFGSRIYTERGHAP